MLVHTTASPLFRPRTFGSLAAALVLQCAVLPALANDGQGSARHNFSGPWYYDLDLERSRVSNDLIEDAGATRDGIAAGARARGIAIKREGGGRQPEVVFDTSARSRVLVVQADATPPGTLKDRSELQLFGRVTFDRSWKLGLRVFIPNTIHFTDNWHLMAQCHQSGGDGALSPPLSLNLIAPNKIALVSRSDADRFDALVTEVMPKNRWVRIELVFRMGDRGHVTMWMDGRKVIDRDARLRFKAGKDECALKLGIYRGRADKPFEIRFDDIRFGDAGSAAPLR